MPFPKNDFEKIIASEKTSLFNLYEDNILCLLDKKFFIIDYNPFAQCFFRKMTTESLTEKKIWEVFQSFEYPIPQRTFLLPLLDTLPLLGQQHQLSNEIGLCWNLCPISRHGHYLFMAQLYKHSPNDLVTKGLISAKQKAEHGNQAKLDFLANMSHELRNSLNGILGMTQILSLRSLPKEAQDDVRDIYQSGNHLLSLVSDMLDFAKLEAGELNISSDPFNVRKMMSDIVNHLTKQCTQRHLDLILDYCDDIPRQVLGDANRLRQIILNLVTNAMKFTLSGHIVIGVELLEKTKEKVLLQFIIEDTGIGIPENKIETIFNRFSQVRSTDETELKGSGLGLAIVKQLVEKMGGAIGVKSQLGFGTTFWVNLPFVLQDSQIEMISWNKRFPDVKILVVDDNPRRAKVILKQIMGEHNRAIKGKSIMETLRALSANKDYYDIILIDDQIETSSSLQEMVNFIRADETFQKTMICGLVLKKQDNANDDLFYSTLMKPLHPSAFINDLAQAWEAWQAQLENKVFQKTVAFKKITALLVEDNLMSQKVACLMLKELGCDVVLAESGHQALEKIRENIFDIIFLDIGLPDITGYDLAKNILQSHYIDKTTPLIALTAHALEGDKQLCLNAGMSDILIKPITFASARSILLKWTSKQSGEIHNAH